MIETFVRQPIYIIVGISAFLVFAFILYFARMLMESRKAIMRDKQNKQTLIDKINNQGKGSVEISIDTLRNDLGIYKENMQTIQETLQKIERRQEQAQQIPQGGGIQGQEQIRIMNQNIRRFINICREKDAIIEEKNTHIYNLQQRLKEIEQKLQQYTTRVNIDIINNQLTDIDKQIVSDKRKNRVFTILLLLFILIALGGGLLLYMQYLSQG